MSAPVISCCEVVAQPGPQCRRDGIVSSYVRSNADVDHAREPVLLQVCSQAINKVIAQALPANGAINTLTSVYRMARCFKRASPARPGLRRPDHIRAH